MEFRKPCGRCPTNKCKGCPVAPPVGMALYVVKMSRWKNGSETHYIEGVYDNETVAISIGQREMRRSAGKYKPQILTFVLNEPCKKPEYPRILCEHQQTPNPDCPFCQAWINYDNE